MLNIAKDHKPQLTRQYYNGNFCIYDKCWFATYKYKGVDISQIPSGVYQLYLELNFVNYSTRQVLNYFGVGSSDANYRITVKENIPFLEIKMG